MESNDLKPGATILVPAGASLARDRAYQLVVDRVFPSQDTNLAHVGGTQLRADGSPTRRKYSGRADVVEISKLVLLQPA